MAEKIFISEVEARFNTLLDEYGNFLRATIAKLCPKDLGLQFGDIEQEVRIRLWRALQSEREIRDAASYIYRVAATTTIDAVRRVKARREEQIGIAEEEGEDEVSQLAASPKASPERVARQREVGRKIEACLLKLSDDRARAVRLYLEGLGSQEIADLTGWTEPKARNLTYRGLNDLRGCLRTEGIECEVD